MKSHECQQMIAEESAKAFQRGWFAGITFLVGAEILVVAVSVALWMVTS